jgi:hypothetical protein
MSDNMRVTEVPGVSGRKLGLAVVVALIVAAIVLVVAVLPAEYGIDPLGTGAALGLSDLTAVEGDAAAAAAPPAAIPDATIMPVLEAGQGGEAPKVRGALIARPARYNVDSREITLAPKEGMEIKYNMKKGSGLVYSWTTSRNVRYEFHGEPDVTPPGGGSDYFESYDLDYGEGKSEGHGTFVAPSTGVHGWFWENTSDEPVTLKLTTAGFYDWIFHNREEKQTALKPMDPYELPSHPTIPDVPLK